MLPAIQPDYSPLIRLAVDSVHSEHTKRAYAQHLRAFFAWLTPGTALNRQTVNEYKAYLQAEGKGSAHINLSLAALKCLAREAAANELMSQALADGIARISGIKRLGSRAGRWLDRDTARRLLAAPDPDTLHGKRDLAVLALLLGCGLRRAEASALEVPTIQERDGRTLLVDFRGKGERIRSVVLPVWAAAAVRAWLEAATITEGRVLRQVSKWDTVEGDSISPAGIRWIIHGYGQQLGVPLSPHDLRRTFAKLARRGGAELESIRMSLGHSSVTVTEIYLGAELDLADPAGDHLGL